MKLLITDLDNTLYDWVTFFSQAFAAMVKELSSLINVEEDIILDEFKSLHQLYGNTEQPFVIMELPCVKSYYGDLDRQKLLELLNKPLHSFNSVRKKHLKLYEGVEETLIQLKNNGVIIVGYTEAIAENGYYRLQRLGVLNLFTRLYALASDYPGHPDCNRQYELTPDPKIIRIIPKKERKPNPRLLLNICKQEGVPASDAWYIGDSLTKDISMAKEAGVKSIWAKYGIEYDPSLWKILVRVTHWTQEDVEIEGKLKEKYRDIKPDYQINSFNEILEILK